jgi:serine/threonine protein kinase
MTMLLEHPTAEELNAFGLGQLDESELSQIEGHLADCDACRQSVESVADDTLIALLKSADTEPSQILGTPRQPSTLGYDPGAESSFQASLPEGLVGHPRYRVERLLGVGGMGCVYQAEHLVMQRPVALKILSRHVVDKPETSERFEREIRAAARLAHPNIVAAFDAEQAGDVHFLAMEFVEGISLARLIAESGPLSIASACNYIRQAALGLQHAFERGMVHRDVKPQNLMLTPQGEIKILDFGLARFAMESAPAGAFLKREDQAGGIADASAEPLTQCGIVMGTPDYIAPEQARDSHTADIRADIYSLGCTLYDLLAGRAPFPDGSAAEKVKAHMESTPRPLDQIRSDMPSGLLRIINRMMAKDPADRFETPAEVAEALKPFLKFRPRPPRRRSRTLLAVGGALAVILLAGVTIYVQTDKGKLIIETDDPQVAVMIEKGDGVKIVDQNHDRTYRLQPGAHDLRTGKYRIEVSEETGGLKFDTNEFTLTRGTEKRVRAFFESPGQPQRSSGFIQGIPTSGLLNDDVIWETSKADAYYELLDLHFVQKTKRMAWTLVLRASNVRPILQAGFYDKSGKRLFAYGFQWEGHLEGQRSVITAQLDLDGIADHVGSTMRDVARVSLEPGPAAVVEKSPKSPFATMRARMIQGVTTGGLLNDHVVWTTRLEPGSETRYVQFSADDKRLMWALKMKPGATVPALEAGFYDKAGKRLFATRPERTVAFPKQEVIEFIFDLGAIAARETKAAKGVEVILLEPASSAIRTEAVPLRRAKAHEVVEILKELFILGDSATLTFSVDERTNTVFIQGTESSIEAVKKIINRLEADPAKQIVDLSAAERKIVEERVALLKKMLDQKEDLFKRGVIAAEDLLEAKKDAAQAELSLAKNQADLVKIHERLVQLAREREQRLETLYKKGFVPESELLKARLERGSAEAALEQAKTKAEEAKKNKSQAPGH